jgi:hypothetical protein
MWTKSDDKKSWLMPGLQEQRVDSEEKRQNYIHQKQQQEEKVREPGFIRVFSSYVGGVG